MSDTKNLPVVNIILAIILIATVIWRFPRLVGAFCFNVGLGELKAVLQQPWRGEDSFAQAITGISMAIDWDAASDRIVSGDAAALERDRPMYAVGAHFVRAELYSQEGKWGEALREYRAAASLLPDYTDQKAAADFDSVLAQVYSIAVQRAPSNGRSHYLLAKYLDRIGQGDKAIEEFRWVVRNASAPTLSDSQVGEAHYRLGLYYEDRGEIERAMEDYGKALELNDRLIDAYARLERRYRENSEMARAEGLKGRLASLEPEYEVGEEVNEEWVLVGYDLDEEALEAGTSIDMALYWLPSKQVKEMKESGWYQAGERWIQTTKVRNLVLNGGFEWDETTGDRLPWGWPSTVYRTSIGGHKLVVDQRNGKETTCAKLVTGEGRWSAALSTRKLSIKPDGVYLQAGWMKSRWGAMGYLGTVWLVAPKDHHYSWVAEGVDMDSWTHFAGIVRPVEGAESCYSWFLSDRESGELRVDDILFFELEIPTTTKPLPAAP